jgi:hypothetical protein
MEDTFSNGKLLEGSGHVAFHNLDLAFDPGEVVFISAKGSESAGIFRSGQYGRTHNGTKYFTVTADVIDWNGRRCGLLSQNWTIWDYDGLRAVTALDISPLKAHAKKEDITASLIRRGRVFEKLRGQLFMAYTNEHEERVNERTIIDARAYHKYVL